jgi:long-chain acyl-CoA synthetase
MTSAVLQALAHHANALPRQVAVMGNGTEFDFDRLYEAVEHTADMIASACSTPGPIAVLMDNMPANIIIDLALVHLGRPAVPIPGFFTEQQRSHALAASGARYLLVQSHQPAAVITIAGTPVRVVQLDSVEVKLPRGTAKVTFTSGSTGSPKGVCLSQAMMEETASAIVVALGADYAGVHCAVLPLGVLLENVAGLYAMLLAGGCYMAEPLARLGFPSPFLPDFMMLASALRQMKATSAILVPELLRGLMHALEIQGEGLPSLRFLAVGGAAMSPTLLAKAKTLNLPVYEGYGLSEAGSVVSLNLPGAMRLGTTGRLLPHIRAHIADDGELMIEHPVFLGLTGHVAAPRCLATGDLVAMDQDGYLGIVGRKSARIITSFGRNIAPEWVERELLAQPAIAQALVYGDGAGSLSALLVPSSAQVNAADIEIAVIAANATMPAYAKVMAWRPASPFTPRNGQLTSNGRLRRATIHEAYGIASSPSLN